MGKNKRNSFKIKIRLSKDSFYQNANDKYSYDFTKLCERFRNVQHTKSQIRKPGLKSNHSIIINNNNLAKENNTNIFHNVCCNGEDNPLRNPRETMMKPKKE